MSEDTLNQLLETIGREMSRENFPQVESLAGQVFSLEAENPVALHAMGLVCFKTQRLNDAMDYLFRAMSAQPDNQEIYTNAAAIISFFPEQLAEPHLPQLQRKLIDAMTCFKAPLDVCNQVFERLGFIGKGVTPWKDDVYSLYSLPLLLAAIRHEYTDLALALENIIFTQYVRGDDSEERFKRCTAQWYPQMETLGQKLSKDMALPALGFPLSLGRETVAFFIHNESVLAHIQNLFNLFESYNERGGRDFEAIVFSFGGFSEEMRSRFKNYGVEVVNLSEMKPQSAYVERLVLLREQLQTRGISKLVWLCLTTMMPFAFGLRVAREQIWYSVSFRGVNLKSIDRKLGGALMGQSIVGDESDWHLIHTTIASDFDSGNARGDAESIRKQIYDHGFDTILGSFARQIKFRNQQFIETVAAILKDNPRSVFLWSGTEEDEKVVEYIRDAGIEHQSLYVGWVDTSLYCHVVDLFLDTFPFPCGMTIYQAMAAGKPTVSLKTQEALRYTAVGPVLSAVGKESLFLVDDEQKHRIKEIYGDSAENFGVAENTYDYQQLASALINDEGLRESVGGANKVFAEEFLLSKVRMADSFDRAVFS